MAKRKHTMELTPIMSLSIVALFFLMIPIFTLSGGRSSSERAQAAPPVLTEPTPTPEPGDL